MTEHSESHPRSLKLLFPILKAIAFLIFHFFAAPIRTRGRANVPKRGALLVISNHLSNCDPVVVQYACPRLVHFLARKELFEMPGVKKFTQWFRAVPIKQSSPDKGALKKAIEYLSVDEAVAIFPEGQLSPTGELLELFEGTALIVRKSQATCICVGIRGSNNFMPHPTARPRWSFKAIRVAWGVPRKFHQEATTEEIMSWIENELRSLTKDS